MRRALDWLLVVPYVVAIAFLEVFRPSPAERYRRRIEREERRALAERQRRRREYRPW